MCSRTPRPARPPQAESQCCFSLVLISLTLKVETTCPPCGQSSQAGVVGERGRIPLLSQGRERVFARPISPQSRGARPTFQGMNPAAASRYAGPRLSLSQQPQLLRVLLAGLALMPTPCHPACCSSAGLIPVNPESGASCAHWLGCSLLPLPEPSPVYPRCLVTPSRCRANLVRGGCVWAPSRLPRRGPTCVSGSGMPPGRTHGQCWGIAALLVSWATWS